MYCVYYRVAVCITVLTVLMHNCKVQLIDNLGKDKTLKAQNARVKKWVNNNFKEIGITKVCEYRTSRSRGITPCQLQKEIAGVVKTAHEGLTARSRSVAYINGLFALIKPEILAAKLTEVNTVNS